MANHAPRSGALRDLYVRELVTAAEPKQPHFIIRTQPRAERQLRERLLSQGFEPLGLKFLPGFLFARFHPSQRLQIAAMAGVHSIIGFAAQPVAVDDAELEALVRVVDSRLDVGPAPYPAAGVFCRLIAGPLEGVGGILMGTATSPKLILSLSLLQRSIAVSIEPDWIAPSRPSY